MVSLKCNNPHEKPDIGQCFFFFFFWATLDRNYWTMDTVLEREQKSSLNLRLSELALSYIISFHGRPTVTLIFPNKMEEIIPLALS